MIQKLAIIGVGLIGGSLARALREAGLVGEIVGAGRSPERLQQALDLGVIDQAAVNAGDAVRGADMIVLAVPMGSMEGALRQIAPWLEEGAVITDVGSVKGATITAARAALGVRFVHFVPGHPIAGLEKSGVAAATSALFRGRRIVLTPTSETHIAAVERVSAMWQAAGADVVTMAADQHDKILAATSHLPHLLAYTLVDMLVRAHGQEVFDFAAGGLRDFTRIAGSDPVMWRDIALTNREAILDVLVAYRAEIDALMEAIDRGDGRALQDRLTRAKQARDAWQDQER
jgi:prephenate dehydrogenase